MLKIAYVEDDVADFAHLNALLDGVELTRFDTFKDYFKSSTPYDILIADMNVPGANLFEVFNKFEDLRIPVFIYSGADIGRTTPENLEVFRKQGVREIYLKGRDDHRLVEKVKTVDAFLVKVRNQLES